MTLRLTLTGHVWACSFGDLDSGAAGELDRAVVDGWPGPLYPIAARWVVAIWSALEQARARCLPIRQIVCLGIPDPARNMIGKGRLPPELLPYRQEVEASGVRLIGAPLSPREAARLPRYVEGAAASDAVLTGVCGMGTIGLTALGAV